ncbi:putative metal dependent hydrolase [Desulforapulum autotrophicum HRM2]|uniref:Metal dependent hydrolase n=1 Tax=Desulforapulum autotrophicum (strain ATCC 43914 / DSM 3382 / VKM B-1955 / HRM2) TaxID=177437 RepID=C0QJG6_DESAH|nr:MBL fold metallo-hydrolase [Desulforapulum autotrophicum]ACN15979.1 putative metal dependent hydrolase [Desulforapulum autotrophicum HRM2]
MDETRITVICENRAGGVIGITGEHGFAALIERGDQKILVDTGQGLTLKSNADAMGIDLKKINTIVLSHGHYDHTGGLPQVLFPPRGVRVIAHPTVFDKKYAEIQTPRGKTQAFIGIKFQREFLEATLGARFDFQTEYGKIAPGVFFSGQVPRTTDFEHPDTHLLVKNDTGFIVDPLLDDASLLIETAKGPVIVSGCAHAGIVNVMNHFSEKSGHDTFHSVIGGTHLGFMGVGEQLEKSLEAFDRFKVKLIAVSHCTGNEAAAICYNRFKERFAFANAGWSTVF